ncbi:putative CtpA-like serine protease [Candidatus Entotheonellaceae bacterium PAL068K]
MLQIVREKRVVLLILATLLVSVLTGAVMAKRLPFQGKAYENLKVFTEVLSYVEANYVEKVDPEKLVHGAIRGMLRTLDPHSSFMPPDVYREMQVETEGRFGGLGIEITIRNEILTVVAPIEGTPAYRAGIQAGDKIVKINDESTKDMTLIGAVKTLRGPEGTSVTIGILRKDFTEPRDFTITRAVIQIKSVRWTKLHDEIGYVKLRSFQKTTSEELNEALQDLEEQNIRGLVLDLRNNPGGLLEQAIAVSDEFIEGGKLIVYTKGRLAGQNMKGFSKNDRVHLDCPMVILLNGGSASASEIVAGALQDLERATLIGTKSFGKGSVQTIIPMSNGSGLRLTTAKYYTPKGREINGRGITPDIVIEEAKPQDEEGQTPLQSRRRPILPGNDLSDDPQLYKAVEFLKMHIKEKGETVKAG